MHIIFILNSANFVGHPVYIFLTKNFKNSLYLWSHSDWSRDSPNYETSRMREPIIQIEANLEGPQRDNFGWIWDLFFEDKI